jgi:hypothetical protein
MTSTLNGLAKSIETRATAFWYDTAAPFLKTAGKATGLASILFGLGMTVTAGIDHNSNLVGLGIGGFMIGGALVWQGSRMLKDKPTIAEEETPMPSDDALTR